LAFYFHIKVRKLLRYVLNYDPSYNLFETLKQQSVHWEGVSYSAGHRITCMKNLSVTPKCAGFVDM